VTPNADTGEHRNFVDDRHNLYVGWVLGLALKIGLAFEPVVDEAGNFTDRLTLDLVPDVMVTVVVPYPPDDWSLTDGT
jgi:hypothetical protein